MKDVNEISGNELDNFAKILGLSPRYQGFIHADSDDEFRRQIKAEIEATDRLRGRREDGCIFDDYGPAIEDSEYLKNRDSQYYSIGANHQNGLPAKEINNCGDCDDGPVYCDDGFIC